MCISCLESSNHLQAGACVDQCKYFYSVHLKQAITGIIPRLSTVFPHVRPVLPLARAVVCQITRNYVDLVKQDISFKLKGRISQ